MIPVVFLSLIFGLLLGWHARSHAMTVLMFFVFAASLFAVGAGFSWLLFFAPEVPIGYLVGAGVSWLAENTTLKRKSK